MNLVRSGGLTGFGMTLELFPLPRLQGPRRTFCLSEATNMALARSACDFSFFLPFADNAILGI
jgi:hypothetical protein